MSARSQSLIGKDVALARLDEIEALQEEIYASQLSKAGAKESALSSSLVNSTFGQSMGLTMGENGIMLNGQSVTGEELQTRAQTFFQEEQTRIQTEQDAKLGLILDFLNGIYAEQAKQVRDAVVAISETHLDNQLTAIEGIVDLLGAVFKDIDKDIGVKIGRYLDQQILNGNKGVNL
jgi:hypothetical protein